jgi:hypothetical protein
MLWNSEVLHLTEALTSCLGVVARFPELVVVAGLIGLPVTGEKTAEMVAMMIVVVRTAEMGLNLIESSWIAAARNSGETGLALRMRCSSTLFLVGFLPCFLGFWAPFGAVSPPMILTIEVWVFRVMIREPRGSSSSSPSSGREPSYGAWPAVLVRLWIFDIVNISWILGLCSPGYFFVALPGFVSFGYSLAMIIIRQDVFLQFMKMFLNRLGFLSSQMRSCWLWSQALD